MVDNGYTGSADIYVTERCNENCIFCSAQKGDMDVSLDDFKRYVDNWMEYGIKHINITGGEPLLHPRLKEIIDYASISGMDVALFTNGTLFNEEKFLSLMPNIKWLAISIDGDKNSNTSLGRLNSHYDLSFELMTKVKKYFPDVKLRIASVITKNNLEETVLLGHDLISNKITPDLWRIKQVIPIRKASNNWNDLSISDIQFDEFIKRIISMFGDAINIKPNKWKSKSGDLIVTYPNGESGVSIISKDGQRGEVVMLGNIFNDFNSVIRQWQITIGEDLWASDNYMDEAWNNKSMFKTM